MKILFPCLLIAALALAGCGKKAAPSPEATKTAPQAESGAATSAQPDENASTNVQAPGDVDVVGVRRQKKAPPTAVKTVNPNDALVGAVHAFMTSQLQVFIREKGRMPKDFSEFANARMDSVPRPPEGMKYVIDEANQQVKVVKK